MQRQSNMRTNTENTNMQVNDIGPVMKDRCEVIIRTIVAISMVVSVAYQ